MAEMILVCGLSGSGKTDWAKEFVENTGYRYFCPDDFYAAINGDECIHENEFEVWIAMYQAIHLAEMKGQNCVVDTDALTKTHRTEFLDWFPSFEHHMVYIAAEKWLRYSNNDFRRRHIPEEEMILWSLTSLKGPLIPQGLKRYMDLFKQVFGVDPGTCTDEELRSIHLGEAS